MERHRVLIVASAPTLVNDLASWLGSEGYGLTVVSTFAAAKLHLQMEPTLVITSLKLGEYNGLHVAIRAIAQHIPTVVIGESEQFFEHEAEQIGATYLPSAAVSREQILTLARNMSDTSLDDHRHDRVAWIDHSDAIGLQRAVGSRASHLFEEGARRLLVN